MEFKPIKWMMESKSINFRRIGNYLAYVIQYKGMLKSLAIRDIKGRFKNTTLGYFWHLLNPLSQILIYFTIFTVIFGKDIPNYWIYLSSGMFAFTFFLSTVNSSCNIIIGNSNLITKMTFAREILPMSKLISNLVTVFISYGLLVLLIAVSNHSISINIIYLVPILLIFAVFILGLAFILSSITVYVRDVANATNILTSCLMFAVPIMYIPSQMDNPILELMWTFNPLYYFVESVHNCVYYMIAPDLNYILICLVVSIIVFFIGLYTFKKLEKGFAERL